MSRRVGRVGRASRVGRVGVLAAVVPLLLLSACGLPGDGSVRTIDDGSVPYRLLEPGPSTVDTSGDAAAPRAEPQVYWLLDDGRLTPSATTALCAEPPEEVVGRLVDELVAGPTERARAAGLATAIPPESTLTLVGVADGVARVEFDPETTISADRLPVAVGQIVLTVTSAAGVDAVTLISDSAPAQVPLPGGALTDGPVSADDYAELVPDRFQDTLGCPDG